MHLVHSRTFLYFQNRAQAPRDCQTPCVGVLRMENDTHTRVCASRRDSAPSLGGAGTQGPSLGGAGTPPHTLRPVVPHVLRIALSVWRRVFSPDDLPTPRDNPIT